LVVDVLLINQVQGLRKDYNSSEDQLQQLVKDEQKLSREKLDARKFVLLLNINLYFL
jgi:hypothetical protein